MIKRSLLPCHTYEIKGKRKTFEGLIESVVKIDIRVSWNGVRGNTSKFCEERWRSQVHRLKRGKILHVKRDRMLDLPHHQRRICIHFQLEIHGHPRALWKCSLAYLFFPSSLLWYPTMKIAIWMATMYLFKSIDSSIVR